MSNISVNTITDASGGSTASINGLTPQASNMAATFNRIINGAMTIDQRNAGASVSVSSSQFVLDRFSNDCGGGGVFSVQQSSTAPAGFKNSMALTVTTADASIAAGDAYRITQTIEGLNCSDLAWGSSDAKTVTLSFWVRSSVTGTYGVGLANSAETENYIGTYTINTANTWEQKTITISGDTTGTWLTTNGGGIGIRFDLGSGTNYNGTAGTWQTTGSKVYRTSGSVNWIATSGATFYITGVQLEAGSSGSSFAHEFVGDTLRKCQRYCLDLSPIASTPAPYLAGTGAVANSTVTVFITSFPVEMRATPAVTLSGTPSDYRVYNGSSLTVTAYGINGMSPRGGGINFVVSSGVSAGQAAGIYTNTSVRSILDAEL